MEVASSSAVPPLSSEDMDDVPIINGIKKEQSNGSPVKKLATHVHVSSKEVDDVDDEPIINLFTGKETLEEEDEDSKVQEPADSSDEEVKKEEPKKELSAKEVFDAEMKEQAFTRLKYLLEKTSLYSQFLSQKIAVPTETVVDSKQDGDNKADEGEDEPEETTKGKGAKGKKGQKRKRPVKKQSPNKKNASAETSAPANEDNEFSGKDLPSKPQPSLITGGSMRNYQLQGVEWLVSLYENGLNGILADEMGLGKTIQCIGLFAHLIEHGVPGPFLVVAPLSTLANWTREVAKWAPSIPCVMYHGTKPEREEIRKKKFIRGNRNTSTTPIFVTSYQIVLKDRSHLQRMPWKYIVVDEGHRIKNLNCKLVQELKSIRSANRLLLTGTPLQNNLSELWSMLNFLLPDIFDDLDSFQGWFDFSSIGDKEGEQKIIEAQQQDQIVTKLHQILRPFLLRRVKGDVELDLPTKHEKVVHTKMSPLQMTYYKAILNKTMQSLLSPDAQRKLKNTGSSLQNMLMQLRKCCNHPYLFEWPQDSNHEDIIDESIITNSGKLQMLDRLLTHLKKNGHRVLIFSQMSRMLDILEDYMTLRSHSYYRIDGMTPQAEREEQIQDFNQRDEVFCFLLSTRAGGLGINLTSADIVIFYDNDWNPQMDLQAQDRAHRIGQTKPVRVYRLAVSNSIESKILDRQESKMKLERIVIQKGNFLGARSRSAIGTVAELEELIKGESTANVGEIEGEVTDDFLFSWTDAERKK